MQYIYKLSFPDQNVSSLEDDAKEDTPVQNVSSLSKTDDNSKYDQIEEKNITHHPTEVESHQSKNAVT